MSEFMIKRALYLLFVPSGRIDRKTFWLTLLGFTVLEIAFREGLFLHDNSSAFFFWGFLIWMVMLVCGIFAIYGKRLKDFGRSVLPIVTAIAALIVLMIVLMMIFGGAEYFSAYSEYERKAVIDPDVRKAINDRYIERMRDAGPIVTLSTGGLMLAFTLWVGLTKGDPGENRYGPPPGSGQKA